MAGKVTVNQVQLGDSGTATQNFVWQTNADGTCKLARGNVGATTQDILTVDANGRIAMPQSGGPAFSAYASANTALPNLTYVKIPFNVEEFDTDSRYDNATNYRFTPNVAGIYLVRSSWQPTTGYPATAIARTAIYKNGVLLTYLDMTAVSGMAAEPQIVELISMNGTTDYLEIYALQNSGSALTIAGTQLFTRFGAALLRTT